MEEAAVSFSPSFSLYSSGGFAPKSAEAPDGLNPLETWIGVDDDFEFEFAYLSTDYDVTTDEIFKKGQVRRIFPIFNADHLTRDSIRDHSDGVKPTELTLLLEKSVVGDELDGVPAGTYCVWRPKAVEKSPSRCKKSNSTGSTASKQGKLRDLLHRRSNSEGKEDSFVFLVPKYGEQKKAEKQGTVEGKKEGKVKAKKESFLSAHESFYGRNSAWIRGEKRKSYLPYRRDLVGFFANINVRGKAFTPF